MGLRSFFKSAANLFRTISRPDWKTYWLSIKIVFIGVGILGAIGYLIRIISSTIQGTTSNGLCSMRRKTSSVMG